MILKIVKNGKMNGCWKWDSEKRANNWRENTLRHLRHLENIYETKEVIITKSKNRFCFSTYESSYFHEVGICIGKEIEKELKLKGHYTITDIISAVEKY